MERAEPTHAEQEVDRRPWKRRLAVGAYATVLATGGMQLAETTHDIIRQNQDTTIEALSDTDAERAHPDTAWLMVPGYNMAWRDSRTMAEALSPAFEQTGQVHWVGYSNQGFDMDELKGLTYDYLESNQISKVNLYGHSFGGMVSTELAGYLDERGIDVGHIVLDSTPSNVEDLEGWARGLLNFSSAGGVNTFSKAIAGAATTDTLSLGDFLSTDDTKYVSADLLRDTSSYIQDFSVDNDLNLPPDTQLTYIGSANDAQIDTESALQSWQQALSDHSISAYDSFPAGHASPRGDNQTYLGLMEQVNSRIVDETCQAYDTGDIGAIQELCPVELDYDPWQPIATTEATSSDTT